MKRMIGIAALAVALAADGQLPTEFRLFTKGWNDTENGRFLFDDAAAREVLAAYQAWGVDLMIDLEHQSLEPGTPPEPTARDARGWCRLELRPDGSLWAVNVTWTPDGAARLREKRQRYVSPAFGVDPESNRVTKILNVAITAMPATHETPALVAARANNATRKLAAGGNCMDTESAKKAADIVENGDANAALEMLKELLVSAAGGGEAGAGEPPPGGGEPPPAMSAAEPPPAGAGEDDEKKKQEQETMAAAARTALALTGKTDIGEAMTELSRRSKLAVELEAREEQLAADKKKLEATERRELVGQLVKLGVEIPATAWSDDKGTVPCARLANEPIDELRGRVKKLAAAGGVRRAPTPPTQSQDHGLTPEEIALCAKKKLDPAKYAATRAAIRARSNATTTTRS